jgi:hypothetical protein
MLPVSDAPLCTALCGGNDGPSKLEELRVRTWEAQARIAEADARKKTRTPPRRLKPTLRSADDAIRDPTSDVSEPSLLSSTSSRGDPTLEVLKQREELRQRGLDLQRSALQQRRLELERSALQRREDEVWRREQELLRTPQRLAPRRVAPMCRSPSDGAVRTTTPHHDLVVGQRVQYLSTRDGRWAWATVTRLNRDLSVDLKGDDGITRTSRRVIR